MTESSNRSSAPAPPHGANADSDIELVCGHCGHAFRAAAAAESSAMFRCPACRKAFTMNRRFSHDALDDLDKRRLANPIDRVLADLGKVLGG